MIKVAPSILSADFSKLGSEIKSISNADYVHFDVMDGIFVPNISFGFPVLKDISKVTDMILDVHLMIDSPSRYIGRFAEAGGDIINFHVEAEAPGNIQKTIDEIHKLGKKAGLTVKPDTPAEALMPYIDSLDLILVMTVEPGYGGQDFIGAMLPKISEIRSAIDSRGIDCLLEVDGGINKETAKLCIEMGANVLVAGADIFGAPDRAARINELRTANK